MYNKNIQIVVYVILHTFTTAYLIHLIWPVVSPQIFYFNIY